MQDGKLDKMCLTGGLQQIVIRSHLRRFLKMNDKKEKAPQTTAIVNGTRENTPPQV